MAQEKIKLFEQDVIINENVLIISAETPDKERKNQPINSMFFLSFNVEMNTDDVVDCLAHALAVNDDYLMAVLQIVNRAIEKRLTNPIYIFKNTQKQ